MSVMAVCGQEATHRDRARANGMTEDSPLAPELQVEQWVNTDAPITLAGLRGRVVVLHAFQMLRPGCVLHAIPQARRLLHELARGSDLVVLGLHTVFEHHAAMTPVALKAFLHEYRVTFPVAVDDGGIPMTMAAYGLRGTPSTILRDLPWRRDRGKNVRHGSPPAAFREGLKRCGTSPGPAKGEHGLGEPVRPSIHQRPRRPRLALCRRRLADKSR